MLIRDLDEADWPSVWAILHEVVRARETIPYDPAMSESQGRSVWAEAPPGRVVVAVAADGTVVGTAKMGPNRSGPGAHMSTATFLVAADHRGRGVGTALCRHALDWSRRNGYAAMQFNAVVETNRSAVELYRRLGFDVVGTVPRAFEHPTLGRVGLHVMYHEFA